MTSKTKTDNPFDKAVDHVESQPWFTGWFEPSVDSKPSPDGVKKQNV